MSYLTIKNIARSCYGILPEFLQEQAVKGFIEYKKRRIDKLLTPTALIFFITSRCNARCAHCFYWQDLNKVPNELSLDEIEKIASSLKHPVHLSLTGGEPFLRNDVYEICKIFYEKNNCRNIGIATNGFLTKQIVSSCETILESIELDSFSVQVSLDGLENTHNEIRGVNNGYEKAMTTIRELSSLAERKEKFSVRVSITLQKRNIEEVLELIDLLSEYSVSIKFALTRGQNYGTYALPADVANDIDPKEQEAPVIDMNLLESIFAQIEKRNNDSETPFWSNRQQEKIHLSLKMMKEKKKQLPCFAGKLDGVLYANGDIALCELTRPIGNIKDSNYDFQEVWQSNNAYYTRDKIKNCFCIHGCNLATSMMFNAKVLKEVLKVK